MKTRANSSAKMGEQLVQVSVSEVVRFIQAAHISQQTLWPFDQRGGIVLHAYPDQLKTTLIVQALKHYSDVEMLSDLNGTQLESHRSELVKGSIRTFGFKEFQKIWERDERTSANVEGNIRSLIEEGWEAMPSKQGRRGGAPSRAMCVMCVTPDFLDARYEAWKKNGMLRRCLFLSWKVDHSEMRQIFDCISQGRMFRYSEDAYLPIPDQGIPFIATKDEGDWIRDYVQGKRGGTSRQVLLTRTFNALKWFYTTFRPSEGVDEATRLFRSVLSLEGVEIVGDLVLKRTAEPVLVEAPLVPVDGPTEVRRRRA